MECMSVSLNAAVSSLISNKRRVSAFKALGVRTVGEAMTYYPFRVIPPVPLRAIREATIGEDMAFAAQVGDVRVSSMSGRGYRLEAVVDDARFAAARSTDSGTARIVFFSHKRPYVEWMASKLRNGAHVVIAGQPSEFNGQLQFTHPQVLTVPSSAEGEEGMRFDAPTDEAALARVCRPRPVYHANSRISSEHIHESIIAMLTAVDSPVAQYAADAVLDDAARGERGNDDDAKSDAREGSGSIPDILPEEVRESNGLLHRREAIWAIHDPHTVDMFSSAVATLRYEEAFVSQTAVLRTRQQIHGCEAYSCDATALRDAFVRSLPFELTRGQREVMSQIAQDMARPYPMHRLVEGEVGSGKTVVALAAMLQAVDCGFQAVLVVPTQVLAEQHYATVRAFVRALSGGGDDVSDAAGKIADPGDEGDGRGRRVPVVLLTGGMRLAARRKAFAQAASGDPCIVVATHAAFSARFQAPNLALVVIDEQHRFGVEQRGSLHDRGRRSPHLLVMTATPIPRSAAMTWFGDLDISMLTELPGGRKPIHTVVVRESDAHTISRMFGHIRSRVDAGERAYVVCPRIDEDDDSQEGMEAAPRIDEETGESAAEQPRPLHSVMEISRRLAGLAQFSGIRIATLSGRDDDATKQRVMAGFADGSTPVLVATTVIEVGVDVPQASCIVVFDADRYGLSQLHQLRGRVGRGGTRSWAFLVSRAEPGSIAEKRLEIIHGSLDGARIAQADLELRGAGDVLGDAQSGGKSSLKLLRVVQDAPVIARARKDAQGVLDADPGLEHQVQLAGAVLDFTRAGESVIVGD
jgi:ATP-dependent DNA helicase RecG